MATSSEILNAFIENIKTGVKFTPDTHLDFIPKGINGSGIKELARLLKSGLCPRGLRLSFFSGDLSQECIRVLFESLESANAPFNLTISITSHLCGRGMFVNFTPNDVKVMTKALRSAYCPEGFTLDLTQTFLHESLVKPFADVLAEGLAPKGFTLKLGNNYNLQGTGDQVAEVMAHALETGNCPEDFSLDMSTNGVTEVGARKILAALETGKVKRGTTIDLTTNNLGSITEDVATLLRSGTAPQDLTFKFTCSITKAESIWAALPEQCPVNLRLVCDIRGDDVEQMAKLLTSRSCPPELTFNLQVTTDEQWATIMTALKSGQCPPGLHLRIKESMGSRSLTPEHILELEAVLASGCCPPRFHLEAECKMQDDTVRLQQMLLENNNRHYRAIQSLFTLKLCAQANKLTPVQKDVGRTIAKMILPTWWDDKPRESLWRVYPDLTTATPKPEQDILGIRQQLQSTMWASESRIRFHKKRAAALLTAFGRLSPEACLQLIENQLACYRSQSNRVPLPNGLTEFEQALLEPRFKRLTRSPPKGYRGYYHTLLALKAELEKVALADTRTPTI